MIQIKWPVCMVFKIHPRKEIKNLLKVLTNINESFICFIFSEGIEI